MRGKDQAQIAQVVDVSIKTVQNDMAVIRQRWREAYVSDFARGIVNELGKLEEVWADAWEAWENSKNDTITTEEKETKDGVFSSSKRVTTAGNPRFLEILTTISVKRMEALGMVFDVKRKQDESRGKYGHGYEIVTVTIEDRTQAAQAMKLEQFRHQFVGYQQMDESKLSVDELVKQQVAVIEPAPTGNGNGKHATKQEGNGHE